MMTRVFFLFAGWGAVKRQKPFPPVTLITQIEPNGGLIGRD
jgi:hypothetical protein